MYWQPLSGREHNVRLGRITPSLRPVWWTKRLDRSLEAARNKLHLPNTVKHKLNRHSNSVFSLNKKLTDTVNVSDNIVFHSGLLFKYRVMGISGEKTFISLLLLHNNFHMGGRVPDFFFLSFCLKPHLHRGKQGAGWKRKKHLWLGRPLIFEIRARPSNMLLVFDNLKPKEVWVYLFQSFMPDF